MALPTFGPETAVRNEQAQAIAGFMRGFSLEATRPPPQEIAALAKIAPAGTQVYVSAVPYRPVAESIATAARLRASGFEPVPHLAVRNFASVADIDEFLARMRGEAGTERFLVIAGDRDEPAGTLHSAIDVIDGALLRRHGVQEVGLAGYPDGHPRISQGDLDRILIEKIAAAEEIGLAVHIVTQFTFHPGELIAWLKRLRAFGVEHPVRVGLAGPTSFVTLMRYARRCGVRATAQALARQAGLARQLFTMWTPGTQVGALAEAHREGQLGALAPHFFSFGGLLPTARWANQGAVVSDQ
ncbi:MAG TPA: methylenetetrahydrofolate reductase [Xanthobacteraceae bacterium]